MFKLIGIFMAENGENNVTRNKVNSDKIRKEGKASRRMSFGYRWEKVPKCSKMGISLVYIY